ncbi:hypothetical protein HAX54_053026 [Datura stramonium]|uniref:Uncharacterized protein n=1 Tax=Datura stramonium TaxID=4076 RepID=A0ABS8SZS4_DATST|nr:hypothetical protein [Datura stramonium]
MGARRVWESDMVVEELRKWKIVNRSDLLAQYLGLCIHPVSCGSTPRILQAFSHAYFFIFFLTHRLQSYATLGVSWIFHCVSQARRRSSSYFPSILDHAYAGPAIFRLLPTSLQPPKCPHDYNSKTSELEIFQYPKLRPF